MGLSSAARAVESESGVALRSHGLCALQRAVMQGQLDCAMELMADPALCSPAPIAAAVGVSGLTRSRARCSFGRNTSSSSSTD